MEPKHYRKMDATILRCEQMLANVFMCIHKLRTGEAPIKPLKQD